MIKKIIYTVLFMLAVLQQSFAQDLGLSFMRNVWQSNNTNPAFITEQKFVFNFPGISGALGHSPLAYNDLLTTNENGENVIDGTHLVNQLSDHNFLMVNGSVETFGFSFGGKNWRGFINHAIRANSVFNYPKTLAQFMLEGNAQFAGKEINIAPKISGEIYSEIGIGGAVIFNKFTLGARFKLLNGVGNIHSSKTNANVYTNGNETYQLTLTSDYAIQSAGLINIQGLDKEEEDFSIEVDEFSPGDIFGMNGGFAFDVGIDYKISEKLNLSASIVDFGKINWENNATTYTSQGSYTYKGFDLLDIIENSSYELDGISDTLSTLFNFTGKDGSYSTSTPMKTYFTINYKVGEMFSVGGLFHTLRSGEKTFTAFGVSGSAQLGKMFSLGTLISSSQFSAFNLGLNGTIKLGPVQLFAATDNILAAFKPLDHKYAHARFGLNLAFK